MKTLLATVIALICVASAQAKPFYTNYIVPNDYRGPLVIIFHPEKGLELPPSTNSWTFTFDSHGKITVKSAAYIPIHASQEQMENYAGPRAKYSNEKLIPMEGKVSDDEVGFRSVYGVGPGVEKGETAGGAVYFFIGTLKEAKQFESEQKKKQS